MACFAYAFIRRSAKKVPNSLTHVSRAVIIQFAKLGDMVCTTPLFHAFKVHYPGAELEVIGMPSNTALMEYNKDIDHYLPFRGILHMISILRKHRYDFGAVTTPSVAGVAVLFLGGVNAIATSRIVNGHSPLETFWYRIIRRIAITKPHMMEHYAPREYLRLLEPIGIQSDDTTKHLGYSQEAAEKVEQFLSEHGLIGRQLVGISPSAGNKVKKWPEEKFAELALELVKDETIRVLVLGGQRDKEEVVQMMKCVQEKNSDTNNQQIAARIIDASLQFSVDELKALIARLNLFVSVDTGPIYIAEAFDVATVDITGPIDEREQPPIGPRHLVITPPEPRVRQMFVMNAHPKDPAEAMHQAASIPVSDVLAACRKLLK